MPSRSLDRPKLAKLLGMLGSAHDGERAAAALKADTLVRQSGVDWHTIIDPPPLNSLQPATIPGWREPQSERSAASMLIGRDDYRALLNDWEIDFLSDIYARRKPFTPRQRFILRGCLDKVRGRCAARLTADERGW